MVLLGVVIYVKFWQSKFYTSGKPNRDDLRWRNYGMHWSVSYYFFIIELWINKSNLLNYLARKVKWLQWTCQHCFSSASSGLCCLCRCLLRFVLFFTVILPRHTSFKGIFISIILLITCLNLAASLKAHVKCQKDSSVISN